MSPEQFESAKRECTIHKSLNHPRVVQLYEYTETEDEFRLFIEYLNYPDYLADKLEEVFIYFTYLIGRGRDQLKIKKS
jgi:serine/threonine protein kinase